MTRIILWGIGERTKYYLNLKYFSECSIVGFVCAEAGIGSFNDMPVLKKEDLIDNKLDYNYLVIANEFYEEILEECKKIGVDSSKIVMTDNIPLEPYKTYYHRLQNVSNELFCLLEKTPYILVKRNEYDIIDEDICIGKGKYARSIYMQDYCRFRTFEYIGKEIMRKGLPGAVAELGVFRGHFSSLINELFRDRKIYLFDTFEGFDEAEANAELEKGQCEERFILEHKDTSVERMLRNLPFPDKAVVCQGFFPESVTEDAQNEEYAFVSIDVDFEESMYQGIKFFYPRMVKGGVLFIHDYNTYFLGGIKEAVYRYEKDSQESLCAIPIADRAGTLIIVKK